MVNVLQGMIDQYREQGVSEKNALREVVQEAVLAGLYKAKFFDSAAFYGGTALRIFYGLDRFSEDLDFSLKEPCENFSLSQYFSAVQKELNALGLNFTIEEKTKKADSNIKSAFVKGGTVEHLLMFYSNLDGINSINKNESIKVKFEIDIAPPAYASFQTKYLQKPFPCAISMYDLPSLFAGKIHAVLCRSWKNRVKGRDLYDYVFYLSKGAAVNLQHLEARLKQSGVEVEHPLTIEKLRTLLCERFAEIDYKQAKDDVAPFVTDIKALDIWSSNYFVELTQDLQAI